MRIAVTYEEGQVFQHFGHTEAFKLYEVENGLVTDTSVIGNDGAGHHALADLLKEKGVDVLICGGLGEGAKEALDRAGIQVVSGAEGQADEAVAAFLQGNLESKGVNCDHHEEKAEPEEEPEEEHEEEPEDCTSDCGSWTIIWVVRVFVLEF